jgi:hypothetical protein
MHANLKAHAVHAVQSCDFALDSAGARECPMFRALPGGGTGQRPSAVSLARPLERTGADIRIAARSTAVSSAGCSVEHARYKHRRDRVSVFRNDRTSAAAPGSRHYSASSSHLITGSLGPLTGRTVAVQYMEEVCLELSFLVYFFCPWRWLRSTTCRRCKWGPQIPLQAT